MQERDKGQKPLTEDPARPERVTEPQGGPIGLPTTPQTPGTYPASTSNPRPPGSVPPITPKPSTPYTPSTSFHERVETHAWSEEKAIGERFPSAERVLGEQGGDTAMNARQSLETFAEAGKDRMAGELDRVARALKKAGQQLDEDETGQEISRYAGVLGDKVQEAARFLENRTMSDLVDEVQSVARRRPLVFLGGAFAAGFLVARLLKVAASAETTATAGEREPIRSQPLTERYST